MSLNADGRSIQTGMIVRAKGQGFLRWLQQLETTGDRQLTIGRTGPAVGMMSIKKSVTAGKRKEKQEYLYSAVIQRLVSKRSDMDHTVLPANYTMPAFP